MSLKNVIFEYYRVYARVYNTDTISSSGNLLPYNIAPLLEKAHKTPATDRTYQIGEEEARMQTIKKNELNEKMWEMSFIRMRENIVPRYSKIFR